MEKYTRLYVFILHVIMFFIVYSVSCYLIILNKIMLTKYDMWININGLHKQSYYYTKTAS